MNQLISILLIGSLTSFSAYGNQKDLENQANLNTSPKSFEEDYPILSSSPALQTLYGFALIAFWGSIAAETFDYSRYSTQEQRQRSQVKSNERSSKRDDKIKAQWVKACAGNTPAQIFLSNTSAWKIRILSQSVASSDFSCALAMDLKKVSSALYITHTLEAPTFSREPKNRQVYIQPQTYDDFIFDVASRSLRGVEWSSPNLHFIPLEKGSLSITNDEPIRNASELVRQLVSGI